MMLALDFIEPIAEGVEKILVSRDDRPIKIEFDHGLRPADCLNLSLCIDTGFTTEHFIAPKLMARLQRVGLQAIAEFMISLGISRGPTVRRLRDPAHERAIRIELSEYLSDRRHNGRIPPTRLAGHKLPDLC
ncbi:hypothetical protein [Bradyrhizobium sp. RT6a]|uniref:hypothetical protein n=1 Tax=unclassified Bradyrhizobium TaxID=2631580 RepID=UPI00339672C4